MKSQIYFSIGLFILSFIAVKQIRQAGLTYYQFEQLKLTQMNGFYSLSSPEKVSYLPFELREISGFTDQSLNEIACLQDEAGTIFIYNLLNDSITHQFQFGKFGDFKGLTRVGTTYYGLRSDVVLFEINHPYDSLSAISKELNLQSSDYYGLCFDEREHRLLTATKSNLEKGDNKDLREVYAIDLTTLSVIQEPVLSISLLEIENFAKANGLTLPVRYNHQTGEVVSALKFIPTSIAVHPITDEIYILSAADNVMAVFTKKGELKSYCLLDNELFSQPEGITFLPDGTMIVTNQGQMGQPTLLRFDWKTKST